MQRRSLHALALALVLAGAAAAHWQSLALGHLGWDTWPLIASSGIETASDWRDVLGRELMAGRYPHGRFHRPLTTLSFALDRALFGLAPSGYHATDLALLFAGTLALAACGRRLLGPGAGALAAAWLFAWHPLHVETLPVASRRGDPLALFFVLCALALAPRADERAPWRTALCALAAACAVAAKETGVLVLPLLVVLHFAEAPPATRLRDAARASAPAAALVLLVLLVRSYVLGGLGGHPDSSLFAGLARGIALAPLYLEQLVMPQPLFAAAGLARALALASAALLGLALLWLSHTSWSELRRTLLLCAAWLAGALWLTGISGELASWYALVLLPAFALLFGALLDAAARLLRQGRRTAGALATALLLLLAVEALRYTPLIHAYREWPLVSARCEAFLARVREAASGARAGDVLAVPGIPFGLATPLGRVGVRSALGLAEYSVEAWAELALPGPPLRVRISDGARAGAPIEGAIAIDTTPDPERSLAP
jgi:hypothetical protein